MFCMVLFRNEFVIALSYIVLCQFGGIRAIIVSALISGSVSDVNHNKFEKRKYSIFIHFLPLGVWMVRLMMSDFCISVGITPII